ncbi:MAG TPA: SEC-C domain-containing protein, partial [Pyrinomonadaceae bacterium]|nr:SEC-C domain-containing protein [Pyrinomonadaceae bacterium]
YNKHVLEGQLHPDTSSHGIADNERVLRFLAREPRTKRRELSRRLIEFVHKGTFGFRVIFSTDSIVAYVFGATPVDPELPADEQARLRQIDIVRYCIALRYRYPALRDIIGIAVETNNLEPASMILTYMNARNWGPEQEAEAKAIQERYGFATDINFRGSYVSNFPNITPSLKNLRNKPCPCGSGVKYKKCCGSTR